MHFWPSLDLFQKRWSEHYLADLFGQRANKISRYITLSRTYISQQVWALVPAFVEPNVPRRGDAKVNVRQ